MRIAIRVDANKTIATGHVIRCLSIADALRKEGNSPCFIMADSFSKILIEQRGYQFYSLQSDWENLESEIKKLLQIIEVHQIDILLVDSYYVTKLYLKQIHNCIKVMYIDDLGKDVYDVSAIVCYANYYKEFALKEKYPSDVKLFQGTTYVPLRDAFANLPEKKISPKLKEVIVLSGGTDQYNFLWDFSKSISASSLYEELEAIHIICGKYYTDYEKLLRKFSKTKKLYFHKAVEDIEKYMLSADVAVSAAGVTSYELCAVGVPTITYTIADNQQKNAESFYADGIMEYAGDVRKDFVLERIIELLNKKYQNYSYRKIISDNMRQKVDGKGAWRIAKEIIELGTLK